MLDILKDYGRNRISPGVVARVLGMMAQTCTGLSDNFPYLVRLYSCFCLPFCYLY